MSTHLTRRAAPRLTSRAGFSLIEVTVSMTLLLVLMGISTALLRREGQLVSSASGRLEAQKTGLYGLNRLDAELRMAGVGIADAQPLLVQADSMALTFNADMISRDSGDLAAVYINPDADSGSTLVFRHLDETYLPRSTFNYPDTTYQISTGIPSPAETISYWLSKDSTKSSGHEYILFERYNAGKPKIVGTGIIVNPGDTVFQYFKGDTAGVLKAVPMSTLPIYHTIAIHGATTDTGSKSLIDSIRTVHVTFKTVDHDRKGDVYRTLQTTIHLMNSGLDHRTTCGNPPIGITPTAVATAASSTVPAPYVTISWTHAIDDGGGEKDIDRYVIYRRLSTATVFSEPIASVPAGSSSYAFVDSDVTSGQVWVYGVAVQDCTPASSPIGVTLTITIP